MRKLMLTQKDILQKLKELEQNDIEHYKKIELIFEYLNQFEQSKQQESEQKERTRIGYKTGNKQS